VSHKEETKGVTGRDSRNHTAPDFEKGTT
jgi:hypothetical protein